MNGRFQPLDYEYKHSSHTNRVVAPTDNKITQAESEPTDKEWHKMESVATDKQRVESLSVAESSTDKEITQPVG
jgi:hypothetical protein